MSVKFRLGTLNVGTMRGRSGEVVETLSRRHIDLCCVQETGGEMQIQGRLWVRIVYINFLE